MNWVITILKKIEKTQIIYLFTIIFCVGFIIYGSSLFNGFVWDDEEQVLNNSVIRNVLNIPSLFTSSTFNTGGAGLSGWYYKPLMPITFSLTSAIFGLNAFGFHLVSLMFHITNSILVFILFKKIFDLKKYSFSKAVSFILSFLFLIHPANTESVAYVSSTQELLYTFFLLMAVIYTLKLIPLSKISIKTILLINFFVFFSLLSKESGVISIPIIITLIFLFKRSALKPFALSFFINLIFYFILRFPIAKTPLAQHSSIIPIANAPLQSRIITIPYEIFSYVRLLIFPNDLFVAQHKVIQNIYEPIFLISFVVLLALTFSIAYLLIKRGHDKLIIFFLGWISFSIFLILNIYPLDMTIAERWLYSPMIGLLGLTGVIGMQFKNNNIKSIIPIVLLFLVPFFMVRATIRSFDWKDNLSLFSHDVNYAPDSFDIQNNLGVALIRNGDQKNAKVHFERSIELSPEWWTPYNNLGVIYQREGNLENAKKLYSLSIDKGNYYLAYENLAQIKYATEETKDVLPFLDKALTHLPNNEVLNRVAALSLIKTGATESAKAYAQKAYMINSSNENYLFLKNISSN